MNVVFLDTVRLIAMWDETDQWQAPATVAIKALSGPGSRLVTTSFVLTECGNAAARKPYRVDVCLLRNRLAELGDLIEPSGEEIEEAWAAYRRNSAGGASIEDHISFVIMRRLGISDAFTNDRHFNAAGFNTLF